VGALTTRMRLPRRIWNHPANERARVRALVRAATFQARGRFLNQPTEVQVGNATMLAHVGWPSTSRVVYANPPDPHELYAWERLLRPGDLFIDVGASVGLYSLWAAGLGARVVAIEADSESVTKLRENVGLNPGIHINVIAAAAADIDGQVNFAGGNRATSSLGTGIRVRAVTLDTVLDGQYAQGVKIDVEGFEDIVLSGATNSLEAQRVGVFQLEWNRRSLAAVGTDRRPTWNLLVKHGYRICRPTVDGRLVELDGFAEFGSDVFAVSSRMSPFLAF
jgi:FkbM family methyltransferase